MQECIGFIGSLLKMEEIRGFLLLIGAIVAFLSVRTQRLIARKKQAADTIFASNRDEQLTAGYAKVRALHNGSGNMRNVANDMTSEDGKQLLYVLNHWELVSVCIQKNIFDEEMIKDYSCNTAVKLWQEAKPFIDASREKYQRPTAWQEFEWLATRWTDNPLAARKPKDKRWRSLTRW